MINTVFTLIIPIYSRKALCRSSVRAAAGINDKMRKTFDCKKPSSKFIAKTFTY